MKPSDNTLIVLQGGGQTDLNWKQKIYGNVFGEERVPGHTVWLAGHLPTCGFSDDGRSYPLFLALHSASNRGRS